MSNSEHKYTSGIELAENYFTFLSSETILGKPSKLEIDSCIIIQSYIRRYRKISLPPPPPPKGLYRSWAVERLPSTPNKERPPFCSPKPLWRHSLHESYKKDVLAN
tara:strand:+ start:645 stop:962 length:318 start_codon:yes stop_codon:yes gene_type:complete